MSKYFTLLLVLVLISSFLFIPNAHAFKLGDPIIPDACTNDDVSAKSDDTSAKSECGVEEAIQTLINIANWILAIIGSVALAMFVYGGFIWITAAGVSSRIEKGRSILIGTVIGIIIVLVAFTLVRFIGNTFGVSGDKDFEKYLEQNQPASMQNK